MKPPTHKEEELQKMNRICTVCRKTNRGLIKFYSRKPRLYLLRQHQTLKQFKHVLLSILNEKYHQKLLLFAVNYKAMLKILFIIRRLFVLLIFFSIKIRTYARNKMMIITKTYLYYFDPLKPHFYIVKLGFTGVYIFFLISAQKHRMWVLVRTASAVLTSTHNLCFEQK